MGSGTWGRVGASKNMQTRLATIRPLIGLLAVFAVWRVPAARQHDDTDTASVAPRKHRDRRSILGSSHPVRAAALQVRRRMDRRGARLVRQRCVR